MNPFASSLCVGLGAFVGANVRYWTGVAFRTYLPSAFPWATLTINVVGCFLIGLVMGTLPGRTQWIQLFAVVGVLGGFTTFSAFGYETLTLFRSGQTGVALGYVAASVVVGLGATWVGQELAARVTRL